MSCLRHLAILALGATIAVPPPDTADASGELPPVEIREWQVAEQGRPRDPFVETADRVWFVGQVEHYLARLTPSTGAVVRRDLPGAPGPHNLIVDADGIVWYAGNLAGYIGRYDPGSDTIEKIAMPDPAARDPHTLAFDADGSHIWFTVQTGNFIGRLNVADRSVDLVAVPTSGARPYGIRVAPDGTVWAALLGTNRLASVDPATLAIAEHEIPARDARPRRLEITPDGRIWYADYRRGMLGRHDPATGAHAEWPLPAGADSRPYGTALDTAGRIRVVETGVQPNRLIGFDPALESVVSITPIPSGAGTVRHMTYHAPTGTVWFGTDAGTIGRAEVMAD